MRVALAVAAMTLAVAAFGCGGSDDEDTRSPAEIVSSAAPATVAVTNRIEGHSFHGSGFVFDGRRGLVLTATQTIWDKGDIEVQMSDGRKLHARLAARSPCDDVSVLVLHPRPPGLSELTLADGKAASKGDRVIAVGYPSAFRSKRRAKLASSRGTISAPYVSADLQALLPTFPVLLQHRAPLATGTAGGPLLDRRGRVIGMNTLIEGGGTRHGHGRHYAVASTHLQDMLDELKPRKTLILGGWKDRHDCHDAFSKVIHRQRGFTPERYRQETGHHEH